MISDASKIHFERICRDVITSERERGGIGRLNEKRLHTIFKLFVCEDKSCHEVRVFPTTEGEKEKRFVADILRDCDIFEIQTGHLLPLSEKIGYYLNETGYNITVIHPLVSRCYINRLDQVSGDAISRRRSPYSQKPKDILPELYPLIPFLESRRLKISVPLIEAEEFRIVRPVGKKGRTRSEKYEKIPTSLIDILDFSSPADYIRLLPDSLGSVFTAAEFGRAAGFRGIDTYSALKVFIALGLIREEGRRGRAATYTISK